MVITDLDLLQKLAVVAIEDWNIYSINIKTAYLYGDLDQKIYME